MGPSCKRRKPEASRKSKRFKSSPPSHQDSSVVMKNDSSDHHHHEADDVTGISDDVCSTPKAERYRIPAIETCPPAPKKRRVTTTTATATSFSLRRSNNTPIAFFAPPDIELFFYFALRGVSV